MFVDMSFGVLLEDFYILFRIFGGVLEGFEYSIGGLEGGVLNYFSRIF